MEFPLGDQIYFRWSSKHDLVLHMHQTRFRWPSRHDLVPYMHQIRFRWLSKHDLVPWEYPISLSIESFVIRGASRPSMQ